MEYVYGALLLHKLGKPVNEENLKKVIEATGSKVDEAKVKTLVASLKDVDIDKELESATLAAAAPTSGGNGGEDKSKEEEDKEKEEKKEEAAEGLSSLF
jgi:large subunit ribosomal protein L12